MRLRRGSLGVWFRGFEVVLVRIMDELLLYCVEVKGADCVRRGRTRDTHERPYFTFI